MISSDRANRVSVWGTIINYLLLIQNMSEHRETRWFRGIVLFFAVVAAIVSFFNILYYNRLRLSPSTIVLPISYTTITVMLVVNLIVFILALIIAFWSIFRLVEPATTPVVAVVAAKPDCSAKARGVAEARKALAEKTREYESCAGPAPAPRTYLEGLPAGLEEPLSRYPPRRPTYARPREEEFELEPPMRQRFEREAPLPREPPLPREGYRPRPAPRRASPMRDPIVEGY